MAALTAIRSSFVEPCRRRRLARVHARVSRARSAFAWLAGSLSLGMLLGCGTDTVGPVRPSASQLLYTFQLNDHAANLALQSPDDTVRLMAIARAADGTVLSDVGSIQYIARDSNVTVSSTGLVTAHYRTSRSTVVARVTAGGITLQDSAVIQVTPTSLASPLATLTLQAENADGDLEAPAVGRVDDDGYGFNTILVFGATLLDGETLCNMSSCTSPVLVSFTSSAPNIATVDQDGVVHPKMVGRITLYVSTYAYGVAKTDSLPFSVGYSNRVNVLFQPDSSVTPVGLFTLPQQFRDHAPVISVGGRLGVTNQTNDPAEISVTPSAPGVTYVFADDEHKLKDTLFTLHSFRFVRFDSAGTYTLHFRLLTSGVADSQKVEVKKYP